MAVSWRVIVASSASVNSRRARCATQRTCSGVMASDLRHREGFLLLWPADAPAADALHADADALDGAALLDLDALEVGLERPLAPASHLAADAAQVLGLAAVRVLVALDRLLTANRTLHAHDRISRAGAPSHQKSAV